MAFQSAGYFVTPTEAVVAVGDLPDGAERVIGENECEVAGAEAGEDTAEEPEAGGGGVVLVGGTIRRLCAPETELAQADSGDSAANQMAPLSAEGRASGMREGGDLARRGEAG